MKISHAGVGRNSRNVGFTFVEVAVVIAILGTLLAITIISARDWLDRYRIEAQTKEVFIDLLNTRVRALQKNRIYFVSLQDPSRYAIYEDSHPSPDGDGDLQPDRDKLVFQKMTRFPLTPHFGLGLTTFSFDTNGLITLNGTIHFDSSVNPFSDCIKLFTTRILMGKWNGSSCIAQ